MDCYALDTASLAKQALQVAVEGGERQAGVQHIVGADSRTQVLGGLVTKIDHWRVIRFGGNRHRDQARVLAMGAADFDQRLLVVMGDHFEPAVGQTLPALGALKPACLTAKDVENVHALFLPGSGTANEES